MTETKQAEGRNALIRFSQLVQQESDLLKANADRSAMLDIQQKINEDFSPFHTAAYPVLFQMAGNKTLEVKHNIIDLEIERYAWSLEKFPEATAVSSLAKAGEELEEIRQDLFINKPEVVEFADALMCIMDSAQRAGFTLDQIVQAYADKLEINKARKWSKNADNTYSHVKG